MLRLRNAFADVVEPYLIEQGFIERTGRDVSQLEQRDLPVPARALSAIIWRGIALWLALHADIAGLRCWPAFWSGRRMR